MIASKEGVILGRLVLIADRLKRRGHFLQEPEGLPACGEAIIPWLTDRPEEWAILFSPVHCSETDLLK